MIHITHTGYWAGQTWCGVIRADNPDDKYFHLSGWIDNPDVAKDLCPDCLAIYKSIDDDDDDDE